VNLQKLAHSYKKLALKIAPLVGEDLEWAPKPGKEMAHRC
jgi:hypothetical protein